MSAMVAQVIWTREESVERDPRSISSLVSLNAQWKGASDPRLVIGYYCLAVRILFV